MTTDGNDETRLRLCAGRSHVAAPNVFFCVMFRATNTVSVALLAIFLCRPSSALDHRTGTLVGTVTITRSDTSNDTRHRHALLDRYGPTADPGILIESPATKPYRLSETIAVYLEAESADTAAAYHPPSAHPVLDQRGLKFHPQVLSVLAGTTVDFPNGDPVFHNVFSYSQTKEFDLGRYPMGDSRSVTFNHPGVVRVYCDIHAEMNATILVLSNPFFATPNDEGSFVIPDIPEGRYRLSLWYGRGVVLHRTVTILPGETATMNLIY